MKREILCHSCTDEMKSFFSRKSYSGEYVKFKSGLAINEYICDSCGDSINSGDLCSAMSIWSDIMPVKYFPWEHDYISNISDVQEVTSKCNEIIKDSIKQE